MLVMFVPEVQPGSLVLHLKISNHWTKIKGISD